MADNHQKPSVFRLWLLSVAFLVVSWPTITSMAWEIEEQLAYLLISWAGLILLLKRLSRG